MRWSILAALLLAGCDDGVNPNPIYNPYHCQYGDIIVQTDRGPAWACAPAPEQPADHDAGAETQAP